MGHIRISVGTYIAQFRGQVHERPVERVSAVHSGGWFVWGPTPSLLPVLQPEGGAGKQPQKDTDIWGTG